MYRERWDPTAGDNGQVAFLKSAQVSNKKPGRFGRVSFLDVVMHLWLLALFMGLVFIPIYKGETEDYLSVSEVCSRFNETSEVSDRKTVDIDAASRLLGEVRASGSPSRQAFDFSGLEGTIGFLTERSLDRGAREKYFGVASQQCREAAEYVSLRTPQYKK